jgi:hypothetical protein
MPSEGDLAGAIDQWAGADLAITVGGTAVARRKGPGTVVHAVAAPGEVLATIELPEAAAPVLVAVDLAVLAGSVELRLDSPSGIIDATTTSVASGRDSRQVVLEAVHLQSGCRLVLLEDNTPGTPTVVRADRVSVEALGGPPATRLSSSESLLAVYDLDHLPPGLYFAAFLLHAEQVREKTGAKHMRVVVLPERLDSSSRLPHGYRAAFPDDVRATWPESLFPGYAAMVPSVIDVEFAADRPAALRSAAKHSTVHPAPLLREPGSPAPIHASLRVASAGGAPRLVSPAPARAQARQWLAEHTGPEGAVVFLMRWEDYAPEINSALEVWRAAAEQVSGAVVAVPDPRRPDAAVPAGPWTVFPWADVVSLQGLHDEAAVTLASFGETATGLLFGTARWALWVPVEAQVPSVASETLRLFHLDPGEPGHRDADRRIACGSPTVDDLVAAAAWGRARWHAAASVQ